MQFTRSSPVTSISVSVEEAKDLLVCDVSDQTFGFSHLADQEPLFTTLPVIAPNMEKSIIIILDQRQLVTACTQLEWIALITPERGTR